MILIAVLIVDVWELPLVLLCHSLMEHCLLFSGDLTGTVFTHVSRLDRL